MITTPNNNMVGLSLKDIYKNKKDNENTHFRTSDDLQPQRQ